MARLLKILLFILLTCFAFSDEKTKIEKKTICLNMIVKNESKVIRRCLDSVKSLIDYWVIVDTGSTDGTQKIIREHMLGLPGELHEKKWVNFKKNRNEAFSLAKDKADYILFIDADEELIFSKDFKLPEFQNDCYCIMLNFEERKYQRISLVKSSLDWKWEGIVHEIIKSDKARSYTILEGVENLVRREGCRSQDPDVYLKDIKLLEENLKIHPDDERSVFYLAQSYVDAKRYDKALEFYEKRVSMSKFDEEVYWSYISIASLQLNMNHDSNLFIKNLYKAYACRPNRAEPLYHLASYYRKKGMYEEGYTLASLGIRLPYPKDSMMVESWIYKYGLLMECFKCAYYLERYSDALLIYATLLSDPNLPKEVADYLDNKILPLQEKILAGKVEGITAKIDKKEPEDMVQGIPEEALSGITFR